MNTKYVSVTGELIEIEVPVELEEVILEIEESQEKKNRAETRRHNSFDEMLENRVQFEDRFYDLLSVVERNSDSCNGTLFIYIARRNNPKNGSSR